MYPNLARTLLSPHWALIPIICFSFFLSGESQAALISKSDSVISSSIDYHPHRAKPDAGNYIVKFGYLNDNFITVRRFEPFLNVGRDDNITAGFWLTSGINRGKNWYHLNIYYDILTKKAEEYRTDLLSVYPSLSRSYPIGDIRVGLGIVTRGNLGGQTVQSAYHRLVSIREVNLPYKDELTHGILFMTEYSLPMVETPSLAVDTYALNTFRGQTGPSTLRTGLKLDLFKSLSRNFLGQFQVNLGYLDTYQADRYISPVINNGFFQAFLVSLGAYHKINAACWISLNQFGLGQTYFGSTISFGAVFRHLSDLNRTIYP
ncbi:hypothetical protein ACFLQV_02985 [Calditrichota bacterium]